MTTESKKPSDAIAVEAFSVFASPEEKLRHLLAYLDGEHERRTAWEAKVEERMSAYEKFGVDELMRIERKSLAVLAAEKLKEMWATTEPGKRGEPLFTPEVFAALESVVGEEKPESGGA